ncbi:hypothetical protein ACGTN9_06635 [Halobacillus sp. MO56]
MVGKEGNGYTSNGRAIGGAARRNSGDIREIWVCLAIYINDRKEQGRHKQASPAFLGGRRRISVFESAFVAGEGAYNQREAHFPCARAHI